MHPILNPQRSALGLLTSMQFRVLKLRSRGFTQLETAQDLKTNRANVSMIELRARRKIARARQTLEAFESIQSKHRIIVEKGTRLSDIPPTVLHYADRQGIHVRSNMVEIIRLVRSSRPNLVRQGKTSLEFVLVLNERGKLSLEMKGNSDKD